MKTSRYAWNILKEFTPVQEGRGVCVCVCVGKCDGSVWYGYVHRLENQATSHTSLIFTVHDGCLTLLSDQDFHLPADLLTPPCYGHMKGEVAAHLGICPATPAVVQLQQGLILRTQYKVNWKRGECLIAVRSWTKVARV